MAHRKEMNELAELSDLCYISYEEEQGVSIHKKGTSKKMIRTAFRLMDLHEGWVFKITDRSKLMGGMVLSKEHRNCIAIRSLFIHPDFQNRGFGTEALRFLERRFPGMVWVLQTPVWAERNIRFYLNNGYQITGKMKPDLIELYTFEKDCGG